MLYQLSYLATQRATYHSKMGHENTKCLRGPFLVIRP